MGYGMEPPPGGNVPIQDHVGCHEGWASSIAPIAPPGRTPSSSDTQAFCSGLSPEKKTFQPSCGHLCPWEHLALLSPLAPSLQLGGFPPLGSHTVQLPRGASAQRREPFPAAAARGESRLLCSALFCAPEIPGSRVPWRPEGGQEDLLVLGKAPEARVFYLSSGGVFDTCGIWSWRAWRWLCMAPSPCQGPLGYSETSPVIFLLSSVTRGKAEVKLGVPPNGTMRLFQNVPAQDPPGVQGVFVQHLGFLFSFRSA